METKPQKTNTTESRNENLACWHTGTNPQCLRVETLDESHIFPYGYFQHAELVREGGKCTLQIQYQDRIVVVKGKGLEPLFDALERLVVERIQICPAKYTELNKKEGTVEAIEVKSRQPEKALDC